MSVEEGYNRFEIKNCILINEQFALFTGGLIVFVVWLLINSNSFHGLFQLWITLWISIKLTLVRDKNF